MPKNANKNQSIYKSSANRRKSGTYPETFLTNSLQFDKSGNTGIFSLNHFYIIGAGLQLTDI